MKHLPQTTTDERYNTKQARNEMMKIFFLLSEIVECYGLECVDRTVIWNQTTSSFCGFRKQKDILTFQRPPNYMAAGAAAFLAERFLEAFLGAFLA